MMMKGQLNDPKSILSFMLAGKATVTFRSAKTGTHYTYKVQLGEKRMPNDQDTWFVKLLTGPDNSSNFTYIGMIRNNKFGTTRASKMGADSTPVKTFMWVFDNLQKNLMPELLEVWHEGRCGRCGHKLTVPESIATGFGPDCAQMVVNLPLIQTTATPVIDQRKGDCIHHVDRKIDPCFICNANEGLSNGEEIGDDYVRLCREKASNGTVVSATQLEPTVTIQGVTMTISQAEETVKAIDSLMSEEEQGLDNVPNLD